MIVEFGHFALCFALLAVVLKERELAFKAARDALDSFDAGEDRGRVLKAAAELGLVVN